MTVSPAATAGLEVLGEVASYLSAALHVEDALAGVAGVLESGLAARECRIWLRNPDGEGYRAAQPVGARDAPAGHGLTVSQWVVAGQVPEWTPAEPWLRLSLRYQGENLGLLECILDDDADRDVRAEVVRTVARILAPLLSSIELSEDLATEVALRTREIESQRRFTAKIIDSLPVGLYVIDRDYRIQAWNRKRETGTQGISRDDALGRTVFDILRRQPRDLLQKEFDHVFASGQIEEMDVQTDTPDGLRHFRITKIPMRLDDSEVTHVITIGEDVTQDRLVRQQVSQTEKMAAVGQLAAGVMHEINNPLATIGACIEALQARAFDLPQAQAQSFGEYFDIVDSELGRCKSIVDGLLDFSRPKSRAKYPAQVNQIVEDALFLIKYHDRFKRVTLVREFADDLPLIEANAEQLIQGFLDLMLNALDSMDGQGTLTVATALNPDRPEEVMVSISDTGTGIPVENLQKVFEPFFTTKPPGEGTGLGLAITYALVRHHNGRILVDSQVGSGATFRVLLPVTDFSGTDT